MVKKNISALYSFFLQKSDRSIFAIGIGLVIFTILFFSFDLGFIFPPNFPEGTVVVVEKDMAASDLADRLWIQGVIRSRIDFLLYLKLSGNEKNLQPGEFFLNEPLSAHEIIRIMTTPL